MKTRAFLQLTGIVCALLISSTACAQTITKDQALESAKEMEIVLAFYGMNNGRFKDCIEQQVLDTCDSDWVTCIENAWVIQFTVDETCMMSKNEQLGVTLLLDNTTGAVISHYPEMEYFQNPRFCRDNSDCFNTEDRCLNFVYALAENPGYKHEEDCLCRNALCVKDNDRNDQSDKNKE